MYICISDDSVKSTMTTYRRKTKKKKTLDIHFRKLEMHACILVVAQLPKPKYLPKLYSHIPKTMLLS